MKFLKSAAVALMMLSACQTSTGGENSTSSSSKSRNDNVRYVHVPGSRTTLRERADPSPTVAFASHGARAILLRTQGDRSKVVVNGSTGWIASSMLVRSKEQLKPERNNNPYAGEALIAGTIVGAGLVACSVGAVVGANCFGDKKGRGTGAGYQPHAASGGANDTSGVSPATSRQTTGSPSSSTASLKGIIPNGSISGNPSHVINCSWGRKTIIRKNGKWTDDTGHSFSDRTWSMSLGTFATKYCAREI